MIVCNLFIAQFAADLSRIKYLKLQLKYKNGVRIPIGKEVENENGDTDILSTFCIAVFISIQLANSCHYFIFIWVTVSRRGREPH
jgi:hypothetical protein